MTSRRLSHGRRARAALMWAAGLFVTGQLAGGLLLDYAWPAVRFPSLAQLLDRRRSGPEDAQILCLGSSRFGIGLRPSVMRAAFRKELGDAAPVGICNASVPLGDPVAEDFVFKRLRAAGVRPALLVVEVSPETVNGYNDWFGAHIDRQLNWGDVPRCLPDVIQSGQAGRLTAARLLPLYVHRREIRRRLEEAVFGGAPDDADSGIDWENIVQTPNADALEATRDGAELARRKLRHYQIGGRTAGALERLVARCQKRGIAVVLVGAPVTTVHRTLYSPPIDAAYHDYLARLCRTYACRFVDWRGEMPDADFRDIYHLRPDGGVLFSRRLTQEVLAPAWRASQASPPATTSQTASR